MKPETLEQLMNCYPQRLADWEVNEENNRIVILRPKFRNALAARVFHPFMENKFFRINLDDIGTLVWRHCDGKHTVKKIGEHMAAQFGENAEPIYERLGKFLLQLQREKFIEVICPHYES